MTTKKQETVRDKATKERKKRSTNLKKDWIESKRPDVEGMAKLGCTTQEIADILRVTKDQIKTNFCLELDSGRANIRAAIRKAQLEKAIQEKCSKMLIWLGKMYLGQREPKNEIDVSHNMKVEPVYYGEVAANKAKERCKNT